MNTPEFHILVCNSFRTDGPPKGVCNKKNASSLLQYLEQEIAERGIDALVSSAGCLKQCDNGPVIVVHPGNHWYGKVDEEKLDDILDAMENGTVAEDHLI